MGVIDTRIGRLSRSAGRRLRELLAFASLATLLACFTSPSPAPPAPEKLEAYRVGIPDQLHVLVLPEPPIERVTTVRPDGKISVQLVGDVQAAGRTLEEIEQEIETRIARYKRDAKALVSLAAARSTQVTILGQVPGPRAITLERATRLIEAIGQVGGTTRFAAKGRVRIVRYAGNEVSVLTADLGAIEKGDLRTNVYLNGGDVVVVPPNVFAQVGFVLGIVFFPIQQLIGFGGQAVTILTTGA